VTGQDGAYLARTMLQKGYEVHGAYRRRARSISGAWKSWAFINDPRLHLIEYDLTDLGATMSMVHRVQPEEIYNLAAQEFRRVSFEQPTTTTQISRSARCICSKRSDHQPEDPLLPASTSEMFGKVQAVAAGRVHPVLPAQSVRRGEALRDWQSPSTTRVVQHLRLQRHPVQSRIAFRGREFVTRKITDGVAKIKLGKLECLELGNFDSKRDWGYAEEYVDGMFRMMQAKSRNLRSCHAADETVRHFVEMAFRAVDTELKWRGSGTDEVAMDTITGRTVVRVNPKFYRRRKVDLLIGNPAKARAKLGWEANTIARTTVPDHGHGDLRRNTSGFSLLTCRSRFRHWTGWLYRQVPRPSPAANH